MLCRSVALVVLLSAACLAHDHHFANHPEWDKIWPEEADMNGERLDGALPDLSGVWTGSPAGGATHRYFFTPSGGGYGTHKDSFRPSDPPKEPGTSYDVMCLTSDWRGGAPGGCGWDHAICVLEVQTSDIISVCTFYQGDQSNSIQGTVAWDGCSIAMTLPWNKFCGNMSGLWTGPPADTNNDVYVMAHDASSGNLTVWWDSDVTPVGSWSYGTGLFNAANRNVTMNFGSFSLTGVADVNFDSIGGGNWGAPWGKRAQQYFPPPIHTVHMIFMNHLDVGYASFINNVDNEYFHEFYPTAIKVANDMRALEGTDRLVYVTHPWLVSFFMDCPCEDTNSTSCPALSLNNPYAAPLLCPTQEEKDNFTEAVQRGDIVWHAAPFNWQAENMHPILFEGGLRERMAIDEAFYGNENYTITMSDRDVMYVTRSVIPLLKKYGIEGLTVGSNGADYPPQVPKLHVWRDPVSGEDVIVAYHPYGYGGYSKSTCAGPGQCGDCAEAPNGVALCTEFRTDNTGPPQSTDEVIASLDAVRDEYPHASVFASTFDNFIRDVLPVKHLLPVVTMEVGDTWMYGAPSDPLKMAQNREIQRVWVECVQRGEPACAFSNPAIQNMTRFLLKAPEHTWGIPGISGWGGGDDYLRSQFFPLLNSSGFMQAAATWAEQRIYNELAIQALEYAGHPMAQEVRTRVNAITYVSQPDLTGFTRVPVLNSTLRFPNIQAQLAFDGTVGAITTLLDQTSNVAWASPSAPMAGFSYQTLNDTDWFPFLYEYINGHGQPGGFWKPGSNLYSEGVHWRPTMTGLYTLNNMVVAVLQMPDKAINVYGSPETVYVNVTLSRVSSGVLSASLEITWLNKLPTMVGESTMVTFQPAPALVTPGAWSMDKLGSPVDPETVLQGGNQFNHGTWNGAVAKTVSGTYQVVSLDAPNMNPMIPDFPYGNPLPAGKGNMNTLAPGSVFGMGVNLHNNLWNTNYPLYYPFFDTMYCATPLTCSNANAKFRFAITLTSN